MSVRSHKNFQYVFIGGTAAAVSSGRPKTLLTGEIAIYDKFGTRLTEAAAAAMGANDEFFIYLKPSNTDNTLVISPAIKKGAIKKANRVLYTAEQEQIDTIGYNGTTGAVDNQNLTEYLVQLSWIKMLHLTTVDGTQLMQLIQAQHLLLKKRLLLKSSRFWLTTCLLSQIILSTLKCF